MAWSLHHSVGFKCLLVNGVFALIFGTAVDSAFSFTVQRDQLRASRLSSGRAYKQFQSIPDNRIAWALGISNPENVEIDDNNGSKRLSTMDEGRVISAAAAMTQNSCELLGKKSIGVDYGLSRTGVAVTVGYEPKPLAILADKNSTKVAQKIVEYCASEHAKQIIIGLPLHKNGTEAPQSLLTREFASIVACLAMARLGPGVPLYYWDERYTTKEAAARVHSSNPETWLHGTLDSQAACIILENFYGENGEGAERVQVPTHMEEKCMEAWEAQKMEASRRIQEIHDQREANMRRRQESMERARQYEAAMNDNGLKPNKKKKKKKRKKK